MATPKTEPKYISDVLRDEPAGSVATRDEITFKNNTGGTRSFVIGQTLLTSGAFRVPAPAGSADSVLLENVDDIANDDTKKVAGLTHGPATIDQDQLVYLDSVDGTEALAQRTALAALGIKSKREPLKQGDAGDVLT